MTSLHIYTAGHQPATRYKVDVAHGKRPLWMKCKPNAMRRASCCFKRRMAKNLSAQVYYDTINFWCRKGTGCQKP